MRFPGPHAIRLIRSSSADALQRAKQLFAEWLTAKRRAPSTPRLLDAFMRIVAELVYDSRPQVALGLVDGDRERAWFLCRPGASLIIALGVLCATPALLLAEVPAGGEFQVNTYTTSAQRLPAVAWFLTPCRRRSI